MSQDYIINININDTLEDVIRKCNANFRRISYSRKEKTDQTVRISDANLTSLMYSLFNDIQCISDTEIDNIVNTGTAQGVDDLYAAVDDLDARVTVLEEGGGGGGESVVYQGANHITVNNSNHTISDDLNSISSAEINSLEWDDE